MQQQTKIRESLIQCFLEKRCNGFQDITAYLAKDCRISFVESESENVESNSKMNVQEFQQLSIAVYVASERSERVVRTKTRSEATYYNCFVASLLAIRSACRYRS